MHSTTGWVYFNYQPGLPPGVFAKLLFLQDINIYNANTGDNPGKVFLFLIAVYLIRAYLRHMNAPGTRNVVKTRHV